MRILLVTHKFPPYSLGGVEVYTHSLARALRVDHEVAVFYRHDDGGGVPFAEDDQQADGVLLRRVSSNAGGLGASVAGEFFDTFLNRQIEASFARFLEQVEPHLVHFQHVMALSARLLQIARQHGVPTLLTLHDYWFICSNSQLIWPDAQTCRGKAFGMNCVRCASAARFPAPWVRWLRPVLATLFLYRDRVVRRALFQAGRLISPSRFLIEQYVGDGLPRERFLYLENGLPLEHIRRVDWQPGDGPLRVTFLGSLAWQKGVHVLAEAFSRLPAGVAQLRIWGDPALFPSYVERLQRLMAGSDAALMGRIANERVGEVLADSDLVVVPSLWYENSPMVIQEARAAGVPVVASGHGALAEKVRDGVGGLLFPAGDVEALYRVLLRLVEEPDLLPRLRREIPEPMSIGEHVRQLSAIYARHAAGGQA